MNRLIIVLYFGCKGMDSTTISDTIEYWKAILEEGLTDNETLWIIPQKSSYQINVEVINKPILITNEDRIKEIENKFNRIENKLKKILDNERKNN